MKTTQSFLQFAVVCIDVVNMEVQHLWVWVAGREQDVCHDARLAVKDDSCIVTVAAECFGQRNKPTERHDIIT